MLKLFVPGRLCLFGEHTDWAGHYRTMNADILPGASMLKWRNRPSSRCIVMLRSCLMFGATSPVG